MNSVNSPPEMTVSALVSSGRSLLVREWLTHDVWSFLASHAGAVETGKNNKEINIDNKEDRTNYHQLPRHSWGRSHWPNFRLSGKTIICHVTAF